MNFDSNELEFPMDYTFRVMCINSDDLEIKLNRALSDLGVTAPLAAGNLSSSGKYISYKVTRKVESLEDLREFPNQLTKESFIKYVL